MYYTNIFVVEHIMIVAELGLTLTRRVFVVESI